MTGKAVRAPGAPETLGVALDVGTTTIAGASVDTRSGEFLRTSSLPNPQRKWGGDLLARVKASGEPGALDEMRRSVVEACESIIEEVAGGLRVAAITAAGNTVMEHILLGVSPGPLAKVPYRPVFKEARRTAAREAGFTACPDAELYTFPVIGGFVGGDAVAVALSLSMHEAARVTLAVDIGTNSEILLASGGVVYATSAAAGPAFEAGEIECGMTAAPGAIQAVEADTERITLDVIGGGPASGICGSGLIDAVRALVGSGLIEPNGRIVDPGEVSTNLASRIKSGPEGNRIVLSRSAKGTVYLSQADIRSLQVAKSAIRAGINILLKRAGVEMSGVEELYIAGAFGAKISAQGLSAIGLIDPGWAERLKFVGDAALKGAAMALAPDKRLVAEELARAARYVSLSGSAHFEGEFIKNMDFASRSDV